MSNCVFIPMDADGHICRQWCSNPGMLYKHNLHFMKTSSNGNIFRVTGYWPFVRGIHTSPVNSPHKWQWRRALMFSLIYAWINGWVNIGEAGDLRHHRAHYDVIVIEESKSFSDPQMLLLSMRIPMHSYNYIVEMHFERPKDSLSMNI